MLVLKVKQKENHIFIFNFTAVNVYFISGNSFIFYVFLFLVNDYNPCTNKQYFNCFVTIKLLNYVIAFSKSMLGFS